MAAGDRELTRLMDELAAIAARGAHEPRDALEAEQWASGMVGTWRSRPLPGADVEDQFVSAFVSGLERLGSPGALAALRAVAVVARGIHGRRARAAADRLAVRGRPEPKWSDGLAQARPTTAELVSDEVFDDGVSVFVEFSAPGAEPHTLGIYIDHNLGGLVKDAFVAGSLGEVREKVWRRSSSEAGLTMRALDLAEARARVEAALDILDHTYDPPVDDDVRLLRALIESRMRLLPGGFGLPDQFEAVTPEQRNELLADFLDSPEGRRWGGDEDATDVASLAIDFGSDYNHGGPLRWSPRRRRDVHGRLAGA